MTLLFIIGLGLWLMGHGISDMGPRVSQVFYLVGGLIVLLSAFVVV